MNLETCKLDNAANEFLDLHENIVIFLFFFFFIFNKVKTNGKTYWRNRFKIYTVRQSDKD